jgi:GIY-YIG catalytic domain-containing protein
MGCCHLRHRHCTRAHSPDLRIRRTEAPPSNGKELSKQSMWHRLRYHFRGNAEASTLRLTLGCLLAKQFGIEMRRVGSGKRMTFGPGEAALSEWMGRNAFVAFHVCEKPVGIGGPTLRGRIAAPQPRSEPEPLLQFDTDRLPQGTETTSPQLGCPRLTLMVDA